MGFGKSPDSWRIRSLKGTHFTGALATNAIEMENLGAASTPNVIVTRVTLWSDQNLDWDVMFFRTLASQPNADADVDTMVDWVRFAVADGVQVAGAGLFRYAASGLNIRYAPVDGNVILGLINRNAVGKNAGGTGEVVIELSGPVL
jgi:hypothetical protein